MRLLEVYSGFGTPPKISIQLEPDEHLEAEALAQEMGMPLEHALEELIRQGLERYRVKNNG